MTSHAQYIQEEAARLVVEERVSLLLETDGTIIFVVDDETQIYRVRLNPNGTASCTCTDWTHWGEICLHILASQFCQYVHEVIRCAV